MTAAAASPAAVAVEHSFLRHVIPFVVRGAGPASSLWRHAFLHKPDPLIVAVLRALEQVELPELPRMQLAEAFQQLFAGNRPQRDLRRLFTEAEMTCRKLLYDLNTPETSSSNSNNSKNDDGRGNTSSQGGVRPSAAVQALFSSRQECEEWAEILTRSPLHRLLAYELCAACEYYASLMSISSHPTVDAEVALYARLTSDLYKEQLFADSALVFETHPRDGKTGARRTPLSPGVEAMMKENLLLERDVFGCRRFDIHGSKYRNLTGGIRLEGVGKNEASCSLLLDPVVQQYGNFVLQRRPIQDGRWIEYKVSCGAEDARLQPDLPVLETVTTSPGSASETESAMSFLVEYNQPLVRMRPYGKQSAPFVMTFELAVLPQNRTLFERWFMDR